MVSGSAGGAIGLPGKYTECHDVADRIQCSQLVVSGQCKNAAASTRCPFSCGTCSYVGSGYNEIADYYTEQLKQSRIAKTCKSGWSKDGISCGTIEDIQTLRKSAVPIYDQFKIHNFPSTVDAGTVVVFFIECLHPSAGDDFYVRITGKSSTGQVMRSGAYVESARLRGGAAHPLYRVIFTVPVAGVFYAKVLWHATQYHHIRMPAEFYPERQLHISKQITKDLLQLTVSASPAFTHYAKRPACTAQQLANFTWGMWHTDTSNSDTVDERLQALQHFEPYACRVFDYPVDVRLSSCPLRHQNSRKLASIAFVGDSTFRFLYQLMSGQAYTKYHTDNKARFNGVNVQFFWSNGVFRVPDKIKTADVVVFGEGPSSPKPFHVPLLAARTLNATD